MQYTGLQVFSFLVLLIATGLIVVSIATNHWSFYTYDAANVNLEGVSFSAKVPANLKWHNGRRGLWEQCDSRHVSSPVPGVELTVKVSDEETCVNRYSELLKELETKTIDEAAIYSTFNIWEVACLALMCGSAVLGIFMLLMSPCCCTRCPCCLSVWVLFAALNAAAGISLYVYYQQTGQAIATKSGDDRFVVTLKPEGYGYSFWCAVAGAACQLIASILFAVSRARTHSYSHTI